MLMEVECADQPVVTDTNKEFGVCVFNFISFSPVCFFRLLMASLCIFHAAAGFDSHLN